MKLNDKARLKSRTKELMNDLGAVRAAVLNNQPAMHAGERALLETRLFESWAIEKLAGNECQLMSIGEELKDLRQELEALRKSLARPAKKPQKEKGN